jgi:hypothetical protein
MVRNFGSKRTTPSYEREICTLKGRRYVCKLAPTPMKSIVGQHIHQGIGINGVSLLVEEGSASWGGGESAFPAPLLLL